MKTAIKERGILMHARSVNNILAGRKTQTRRIIKPQPDAPLEFGGQAWSGTVDGDIGHKWRCPQGQPGDRLWVRETWRYYASALSPEANFGIQFRADGAINYWPDWDKAMQAQCSPSAAWRPSLFMPRWASRITLEIVSVRVERVQDISLEDIAAEGVNVMWEAMGRGDSSIGPAAYDDFANLWDNTNGDGAWERNDWCWCIEFRRVEAPNA